MMCVFLHSWEIIVKMHRVEVSLGKTGIWRYFGLTTKLRHNFAVLLSHEHCHASIPMPFTSTCVVRQYVFLSTLSTTVQTVLFAKRGTDLDTSTRVAAAKARTRHP